VAKNTNFSELQFDNRFINELPADPEQENIRRQVFSACYSFVDSAPASSPTLVAYSSEVAKLLGISEKDCQSDLFKNVFSGNSLLDGMQTHAQCYGGHQFGNWAGQLGDGRAINLGEVRNQDGQHYALQLKGSGPTPYSRSGDGYAVLRSSLREFLCSEAMHHLGVPTTRALSLITTGDQITRDMFYDGRPQQEPGAVVCRVAPSFLRFGSYEIFASRGDLDTLKQLVDFTIKTEFPHLGEPCVDVYLKWFAEVAQSTVELIVHWMRVGFVHGVLNTDNMSILGLTIDYGPYGWLDNYDPNWTPNTTDAEGKRYRFGTQAQIAQWNLLQLGNALYPLIEQAEPMQKLIKDFADDYMVRWREMRSQKLGLKEFNVESDEELNKELHEILQLVETDMTIFYRRLANIDIHNQILSDDELLAPLLPAYYAPDAITKDERKRICTWLRQYQLRAQRDGSSNEDRRKKMNSVNPKFVLRNYMAQLAIDDAEQGDFSLVNELLELLRHPYDEQKDKEHFAEKRPDWARQRAGCSMLSCSS
jgi:uncharacterized protein YdiU (UPF0061 family)